MKRIKTNPWSIRLILSSLLGMAGLSSVNASDITLMPGETITVQAKDKDVNVVCALTDSQGHQKICRVEQNSILDGYDWSNSRVGHLAWQVNFMNSDASLSHEYLKEKGRMEFTYPDALALALSWQAKGYCKVTISNEVRDVSFK